MFSFLHKRKSTGLNAPADGCCIDLAEVKDPAFASKMLGDGIAVVPEKNVVCSPCDGVLTMIFPTCHAFGIRADDGQEILVHIGIDTVTLKGKGFKALKKTNILVSAGTPVIEFDKTYLNNPEMDMTTMLIITDPKGTEYTKTKLNMHVTVKDAVMEKTI